MSRAHRRDDGGAVTGRAAASRERGAMAREAELRYKILVEHPARLYEV
jgi:hypothetical protein